MPLTANRIAYNLVVITCFAVLLTIEIIRCLSPLIAAIRHKVERTIEWYSLPTVTSNWHTVELIGSLAVPPLATLPSVAVASCNSV